MSGKGLSGCLHQVHLVLSIFLSSSTVARCFLVFQQDAIDAFRLFWSPPWICSFVWPPLFLCPCSYREHFNSLEETRDWNAWWHLDMKFTLIWNVAQFQSNLYCMLLLRRFRKPGLLLCRTLQQSLCASCYLLDQNYIKAASCSLSPQPLHLLCWTFFSAHLPASLPSSPGQHFPTDSGIFKAAKRCKRGSWSDRKQAVGSLCAFPYLSSLLCCCLLIY